VSYKTGIVPFLEGARDLCLPPKTQTGSGSDPASYSVRTSCSFPGVKQMSVMLTTNLHQVCRQLYHPFLSTYMVWCLINYRD